MSAFDMTEEEIQEWGDGAFAGGYGAVLAKLAPTLGESPEAWRGALETARFVAGVLTAALDLMADMPDDTEEGQIAAGAVADRAFLWVLGGAVAVIQSPLAAPFIDGGVV